ncbi:jg933 [Pararge aegeria aegeria]|uniref:Jg933 protein n=1 Tax=Pararge aegeria aegeria TaxID=348720 RepID=A0A8S4R9H6_9NEOP|nr:jg933 [Pararge aegeria aegeria]
MEAYETPTHVLLRCRGVAEQGAAYLGSPASLPEALGDLGGLLSFWSVGMEPTALDAESRIAADCANRLSTIRVMFNCFAVIELDPWL